jgi:hypothetical protein
MTVYVIADVRRHRRWGNGLGLQARAPRDSPTVLGDRWVGRWCADPQGAP